jgi:hypothetical protein
VGAAGTGLAGYNVALRFALLVHSESVD